MAKRRSRKRDAENYKAVMKWTASILCIALGILLALGAFGVLFGVMLAGDLGNLLFMSAWAGFGAGALALPFLGVLVGVGILKNDSFVEPFTAFGIALISLSLLTLLGALTETLGGSFGSYLGMEAVKLFGPGGAFVILLALMLVGLGIVTDIVSLWERIMALVGDARDRLGNVRISFPQGSKEGEEPVKEEYVEEPEVESEKVPGEDPVITVFNEGQETVKTAPAIQNFDAEYKPPPLALLGVDKGKPGVGDIKANANIIKRTFQNFGISVEMDEVSVGPTVTRYAIKPAEGVRLSKIISLQNNLELALAAHPVRIEAPIPGKSLVGIEVPNAAKATVGLGGLLSAPEWGQNKKPLLGALGRDISGTPHYVNISKAPHVLVAGATGSGKTCSKDTYVFSEKGMLTFDELCPLPLNSDIDYSLRVATRDGVETTSKNYNNGICNFYKITTDDGFSIEVTAEHPLWTLENGSLGWKSGGVMRVGDYVAISRGSKLFVEDVPIHFVPRPNKTNKARHIRTPKRMSPELGLLLGLLTADGGLTITNRIVYTQAREEVIGIYIALLKSLFDITPSIVEQSQKE